jgi:FeS assembly SUF system regulator
MTRLTDYGIVLLTYLAQQEKTPTHNARDVASAVHLPLPTVNKILKALTRKGLLVSHRGVKGGYSLARRPEEISVADIITATEGPLSITQCTLDTPGNCAQEATCPVHGNWQLINQAIRQALEGITLREMTRPLPVRPAPGSGALRIDRGALCS